MSRVRGSALDCVLNLDGLVGPSHNYGGLAPGNIASAEHKGEVSSPRAAALQGLEKMWHLHQMGIPQGLLPPQQRPDLSLLHSAGFTGSTEQMLGAAYKQAPHLLEACYSASSMWAANSATVTASADSSGGKLHFTPANLISTLHRSREPIENGFFLQHCFNQPELFTHHPALPAQYEFSDEGAANHIRLSDPNGDSSINLFIYGREATEKQSGHYPARQSKLACESLIRRHQIHKNKALLLQQHPKAIQHGAFHNDVVAVGHSNFLLLHEQTFSYQPQTIEQLKRHSESWNTPLVIFEVRSKDLSLDEAIASYLFNSQLVTKPSGDMVMIAPEDSRENPAANKICDRILAEDNPVSEITFLDLRQSMNNGGGPACLRLAIPITEEELEAVYPGILLNEALYLRLKQWINQHYRDRLSVDDLRDIHLVQEIYAALEELSSILRIQHLYPFQR